MLKEKLEYYGISSFVAHSDIEPTKEWQNEIELALRTCDGLIALMVENFHKSNWTDQEIGLALGRDLLIIPVRMGKDPYGFIGKFQAINFSNMEMLAREVFNILQGNKKTSSKISSATVSMFEDSDSFRSAKKNLSVVENNTLWTESLKKRLRASVDNNSQIKGSFGVPQKIEQLIKNAN